MGWRDRIKPDTSVASNWRDRIINDEEEALKKSQGMAAVTGFIDGAVPFAGSVAGAGKAVYDTATFKDKPMIDSYREGRDTFQDYARESAKENPDTAFTAGIAGGMINPAFRGAKGLKAIVGASAFHGLGSGESDLTKGDFTGGALDAGLGGAGGVVGHGVSKAIPAIIGSGKSIAKKALTGFGPSETAIDARLKGRAQPSAPDYPELAEQMGGDLGKVKKQIGDLDAHAWSTLSSDKNISKAALTQKLYKEIHDLQLHGKTIGPADKGIQKSIAELGADIKSLDNYVSERDIKTLIQKLDDNINWEDQGKKKLNRILKKVRNSLDNDLKHGNVTYKIPGNAEYKKAMIPVARRMGVKEAITRHFNFKKEPGKGLQPTDTTATKIQTSLRDNKKVTGKSVKGLKEFTGNDYHDLAQDYSHSKEFQTGKGERSSARTNLGLGSGATLGAGLGHYLMGPLGAAAGVTAGTIAGGIAGNTMDRYGRPLLGYMIDKYVQAGNWKAFGKFAPIMKAASERGKNALAVTGSILASDPEFRKLLGLDEGNQTPVKP